jgi:hypothetical protein
MDEETNFVRCKFSPLVDVVLVVLLLLVVVSVIVVVVLRRLLFQLWKDFRLQSLPTES